MRRMMSIDEWRFLFDSEPATGVEITLDGRRFHVTDVQKTHVLLED